MSLTKFTLTCLFLALAGCPAFCQDYQKIHRQAVLVDTHNDFPSVSIEKSVGIDQDLTGKTHTDLNRLREGGVDVQIFSIWCGPEQDQPYAWANREIDSVHTWISRNPDRMMLVRNPGDIQKAIRRHKLATMLGVEGGHMIEDSPEKLDRLFERGVRYMTLTWNNSTSWATSAADETSRKDSLPHKGLTEKGKDMVRQMNRLGMIVDLSHTGEQTFWDAINLTTKPVIASHSCVYRLCPHRRNLNDDQIRAIGKNGGVIHLNFYAGFIDSSYEKKIAGFLSRHKPDLDSLLSRNMTREYAAMMVAQKYADQVEAFRPPLSVLLDHLDYIVRLIGTDHVGLGSDFDGIESPPKGLRGVQDFPEITKALMARGYRKKDIRKILGGNFIRVFEANMK